MRIIGTVVSHDSLHITVMFINNGVDHRHNPRAIYTKLLSTTPLQ